MSTQPIQLDYAAYRPDPERRDKLASRATAVVVAFLTVTAAAATTMALLEACRPLSHWGDVLFFAVYGVALALLATLWSVGRTRALLRWNSAVFARAAVLALVACSR